MVVYILCEFEYGFIGLFYQEINEYGIVVRMTDTDGNTLFPTGPYGAFIVDANCPRPTWAL